MSFRCADERTQLLLHTAKIQLFALILVSCNTSCVHKRQAITSTVQYWIPGTKGFNPPSRINSINWVSPCRVLISVLKQKLPRQSSREQTGNKTIALTAVKKLQSPANQRSSPNSLVLGDQTLPGSTEFLKQRRYGDKTPARRYTIYRVNTVLFNITSHSSPRFWRNLWKRDVC